MAQRQNSDVALDGDMDMGIAFFNHIIKGHQVIEHGGNLPPFSSHMLLAPNENIGVFIATNDAAGRQAINELGLGILNLLLDTKEPSLPSEASQQQTSRLITEFTSRSELALPQMSDNHPLISHSILDEISNSTYSEQAFRKYLHSQTQASPPLTAALTLIEPGYYIGNSLWKVVPGLPGQMMVEFSGQKLPLNAINSFEFEVIGIPGLKLIINPNHLGLRLNLNGSDAGLLYPVVKTVATDNYEKFTGHYVIDGITPFIRDFIVEYDSEEQLLYTILPPQMEKLPLEIVGENLLQAQGRGRGKGMIFELFAEDSLYGLGYEFKKLKE